MKFNTINNIKLINYPEAKQTNLDMNLELDIINFLIIEI